MLEVLYTHLHPGHVLAAESSGADSGTETVKFIGFCSGIATADCDPDLVLVLFTFAPLYPLLRAPI